MGVALRAAASMRIGCGQVMGCISRAALDLRDIHGSKISVSVHDMSIDTQHCCHRLGFRPSDFPVPRPFAVLRCRGRFYPHAALSNRPEWSTRGAWPVSNG